MRVSSCLEDWWFYLRGRAMARSEEVDFHCDWIKRSPMNRSFPSHLVSFVSFKSQMTSGADVAMMEKLREEDRWKRKLAKIGAKFANECHSQADLGLAESDIWNSAHPSWDRWVTDIWNSTSFNRYLEFSFMRLCNRCRCGEVQNLPRIGDDCSLINVIVAVGWVGNFLPRWQNICQVGNIWNFLQQKWKWKMEYFSNSFDRVESHVLNRIVREFVLVCFLVKLNLEPWTIFTQHLVVAGGS